MTYTPKLLEQYRECEQALKEAENLLNSGSTDANVISRQRQGDSGFSIRSDSSPTTELKESTPEAGLFCLFFPI